MKKHTYSNNSWKIGTIMMTNGSTFGIGVFVIFMLFVGLSLAEVSIVVSSYLIVSAIGQIPAGIFADRHGYKTTLIIGTIIYLFGTLFFAFAQGFYWFLLGYSLMGLGWAVKDGSDHALLYESLNADRCKDLFKKKIGKLELYTNMFWMMTALAGGYLYTISERLPFYAESIVVIISLIAIITAKEPQKEEKHFPIWSQIKETISQAFQTPNFSKIFIFSALIGSIAITTFQYLQPLYKSVEINEIYFGVIAAGTFLMRGLGAWSAERVGKMFSIDKYLVLHASLFGLLLVILQKLSTILVILIMVGIFYYLRGLYVPTVSTYINEKVDSTKRATMLSVNSQLLTIFSAASLFIGGIIAEKFDLQTTFFFISIASTLFLILYVLNLRKIKAD